MEKAYRDYVEDELRLYPKNLDTIMNGDMIKQLITCKRMNWMCEVCQAILKVLDKLEPDGKKLVELKYWNPEKLKDAEIAAQLNMTRAQVKKYSEAICEVIARELGMM